MSIATKCHCGYSLSGLCDGFSCKGFIGVVDPPVKTYTEVDVKQALLMGFLVGNSTQADISEDVLWEKYKKILLK